MGKGSRKAISFLLALSLLVSAIPAAFSAFAKEEEAYKPSYTENVSEQDVAGMIGDVDFILGETVLTGSLLESIYKFIPSLKSIVMINGGANASDKALFYQELYPERFADLPDGQIMPDELDANGNIVKEGTFTQFFKEHPITFETADDFMAEIDQVIDLVVCENLLTSITFALFMGAMQDPNVAGFATGLDQICQALGIEQTQKAAFVLGMETAQGDLEGLRTYIKNLVHAILPNPFDFVMTTVRRYAVTENAALLYSGIDGVFKGLSGVVTALKSLLTSMGVDISEIQATIENLKNGFQALPTMGEDAEKRLDLEKTIASVVESVGQGAVSVTFVEPGQPAAASDNALVKVVLEHFDLDKLAAVETNGDALKVLYDYLYRNVVAVPTNNAVLLTVVQMLPLPAEILAEVEQALTLGEDDLLDYLVDSAAIGAGREPASDPVKPTEPTQPTEPEETTATDQPETTQPTTTAAATEKADSPDTGDGAIAGMAALVLLSAAAVVLVRKGKHA